MEIPGTTSTEFLENIRKKSLAAALFLAVSGMAQPIHPPIRTTHFSHAGLVTHNILSAGDPYSPSERCWKAVSMFPISVTPVRSEPQATRAVTDLLPPRQIKLGVLFRF
jgi:hypothetical protein